MITVLKGVHPRPKKYQRLQIILLLTYIFFFICLLWRDHYHYWISWYSPIYWERNCDSIISSSSFPGIFHCGIVSDKNGRNKLKYNNYNDTWCFFTNYLRHFTDMLAVRKLLGTLLHAADPHEDSHSNTNVSFQSYFKRNFEIIQLQFWPILCSSVSFPFGSTLANSSFYCPITIQLVRVLWNILNTATSAWRVMLLNNLGDENGRGTVSQLVQDLYIWHPRLKRRW